MTLTQEQLEPIVEAALMVAEHPMTLAQLQQLFTEPEMPTTAELKAVLANIAQHYESRGIELQEVASGFRFRAKVAYAPWLAKLWEERPPRYSRAFLETLAIIAYKQPLTRAEVEAIRGVSMSSSIVKTLLEREWIRVVGYREVPGRPALYATTKEFLDYFGLKSLDALPTLAELKDLEAQAAELQVQIQLDTVNPEEHQTLIEQPIETSL